MQHALDLKFCEHFYHFLHSNSVLGCIGYKNQPDIRINFVWPEVILISGDHCTLEIQRVLTTNERNL